MKWIIFGLILTVSATSAAADKPIPQDPAKSERLARERLEWNQRNNVGFYDKVGKRDPRWDAKVRVALDLAARWNSNQIDPIITIEEIRKALKAAVNAGCDDPLVVYLYVRTLAAGKDNPDEEESLRRIRETTKVYAATKYPAFRRAGALQFVGALALKSKMASDVNRKEAERNFEEALSLLPESVASDERNLWWESRWFEILEDIISGYRTLGLEAPAAFERIDVKLAKLPELEVLRLRLKGSFWTHYGWEARTKAFAPQVPGAAMETFVQRLTVAKKALDDAWKLQPDSADTANYQLDIDKSIGDGSRATMEMWFERAMKAYPDNRAACVTKLDWLSPKWHGTVEELVAFGRACRDTKNWRAGITILVADAHSHATEGLRNNERMAYWMKPEVWADIQPAFEEYLKHYPKDNIAQSKYAVYAFYSNHMAESNAQFQILGDDLVQWPDFPYVPLELMKRMRVEAARRAKFTPPK